MRSAILVCVVASLAGCGPDLLPMGRDGGTGGGHAGTGGGSSGGATGGGSAGGTAGGLATGGGMTAGGMGGGGEAGGSAGGAPSCSPSNCLGCCFNGFCQNGDTAAACGSNGAACETCASGTMCLITQVCGIDPESSWKVQPTRVVVRTTNSSGSTWDPSGGAPDPYANLFCPATASAKTANTNTGSDTFTVNFTSGSCIMKAKDLMAIGFAVEVLDDDLIGASDTILAKRTLKPDLAAFLAGHVDTDNGGTCQDLTVSLVRQP